MTEDSDRAFRHLNRQLQALQHENDELTDRVNELQRFTLQHNTVVSPVHASPSSSLSSLPPLTPSPPPESPASHQMANISQNVQSIQDFAGDEAPPGPTKWLQSFRIALGPSVEDDTALFYFELKLIPGKPAEAWFEALPAAQKDTWAHLRTAFQTRWPPAAALPSQVATLRDKLERDILTEEEALREEDGTYGYVRWVRRIRQIARELVDPQNHLLANVINKVPYAIYRNLPAGSHTSWDTFERAVVELPLRAVECSFQEVRTQDALAEWTKSQQPTPATVIPPNPMRMYSSFRTPTTSLSPPIPTITPTINITPTTPRTPQRTQFQPNNSSPMPQAPSTGATAFWQGAGRGRRGSNLFPRLPATPHSPTPPRPQQQALMLTPGSAPLGSRECWACGQQGHTRWDCQNPNPLPPEEQQLCRQVGQASLERSRQVHQLRAVPMEDAYAYSANWLPGNE